MLSVVSPLYRSQAQIGEFLDRLTATLDGLPGISEVVLVEDCCPEDSGTFAARLVVPGSAVRILRLDRNVGQLAAVNIGIRHARGDIVIVIDADLQDRPEDVAVLAGRLSEDEADVVASGRRGRYTTVGRQLTAAVFRTTRALISLGKVPSDAGLFLAARRDLIDRVLALDDPQIHLVSGLARVGATISTVATHREPRVVGASGYSWWQRLRVAAAALIEVTPVYPILGAVRRRRWSAPPMRWLTKREQATEHTS